MSQPQLLAKIARVLDAAGVSYMRTGSVVSSAMGEPRASHDIDIVVEISAEQITRIAAAFSPDEYRFDQVAAEEAAAKRDMFQLSEYASGDKIDFWLLKDEPFHRNMFARRTAGTVLGVDTYLPQPEDLILQKLDWAFKYESERQYRDALGVYELQFPKLDRAYIEGWVDQLGIRPVWDQILSEAEPLDQ